MKTYLITGGCGFIGSNFIHFLIENGLSNQIVNLDKLTYAGNEENLASINNQNNYHFVKGDICNQKVVSSLLQEHNPDVVVHFAAESHVDNQLMDHPNLFKPTGRYLNCCMNHQWLKEMDNEKKKSLDLFTFTDEVYGSLGKQINLKQP